MFRNVLCPVDFTTFSHSALERAVAIARAHGAVVTGLHVTAATAAHDHFPPKSTPEDLMRMEAQVLKLLREAGAPGPRAIAIAGDPALEIEKLACTLPADLIVMPAHGWTGLMTHACGAVTQHVLCHARAPIIVVPGSTSDVSPGSDEAFHRIVCAVDFSPASLRALRYAGALAGADNAQLTVSYVVSRGDRTSTEVSNSQGADSALAFWRRRLHTAVDSDIAPGVTVEERLQVGEPAAEILRLARDEQSDLIAIGGHRGHPPDCVMSSVVAGAPCPVLVVRVCNRLG